MEIAKVSIVVPIFNVERFLKRCLDSIITQTYGNLEIILVDDGSTDNCGNIMDEYVKADPRIKTVHQLNGGLSDARNKGMELVTGEFSIFVDSDDWLEKDMIQELVQTSKTFQADVVQSAFYYAYDDHLLFDNRFYQRGDSPVILDNGKLMAELVINERVKNFAWGKLYKTHLIKDIPFKKGVLFEDVFWAHQVMQRVNNYVILHQPLCYYRQRRDSIVANYTPRNLDIIKGLLERQCFIEDNYQYLANEANKVLLKTILIHYQLLNINRRKDRGGNNKKELQNYVNSNYVKLRNAVSDDKDLLGQLDLFHVHPYAHLFFIICRKLIRKMRLNAKPFEWERINL